MCLTCMWGIHLHQGNKHNLTSKGSGFDGCYINACATSFGDIQYTNLYAIIRENV